MFPHGPFSESARKDYVNYVPSPVMGKEFGVECTCWPTSLTYSAIYFILILANYVPIQVSDCKVG